MPSASATPSTLDFVVIGAQKAGTTTLWHLLRQHPELAFPPAKEAPFFTEPAFGDGLAAFLAASFPQYRSGAKAGTVSPQYMMGTPDVPVPAVARRLRETVPDARLVALLRDPVDRAISQHRMMARWGTDPRTLEQALADALAPAALAEGRTRPTATNTYVVQGEYGRTLSAYLERFPRDQLHVELTEELDGRPADVVRRVLGFLGVDATWQPEEVGRRWFEGGERTRVPQGDADALMARLAQEVFPLAGPAAAHITEAFWLTFQQWNVVPSPPPQLSAELRARLERHYAADARELERLLGLRVPWGG